MLFVYESNIDFDIIFILSQFVFFIRAGECKNVSLIYECTFANTLLEIMDPWGKVIPFPDIRLHEVYRT